MKKSIVAIGLLAGAAAVSMWLVCAIGRELDEFPKFYGDEEDFYGR